MSSLALIYSLLDINELNYRIAQRKRDAKTMNRIDRNRRRLMRKQTRLEKHYR